MTKRRPKGLRRLLPKVSPILKSNVPPYQCTLTRFLEVETKQTTLIDVVQSLGEYINEDDPTIRGKAVSYLTAVIKALPPKFLSRQQITVLTTFFGERIEDGGAVTGLETLQKQERFNTTLAQLTARA
jgi:DNA repair/transcription protein MET18/MMS19